MTKTVIANTRADASAIQARINANSAFASALVAAHLNGDKATKAAEEAFIASKVSKLQTVRDALKGCAPITRELWEKDFQAPVAKALEASGLYTTKMTLGNAASTLKVCAIALTNGVEPKEGEAFRVFVQRARDELTRRGLWEKQAGHESKRKSVAQRDHNKVGGDVADGKKAKGDKGEEISSAKQAGLILAGGDKALANLVCWVIRSKPDDFKAWAQELMSETFDD